MITTALLTMGDPEQITGGYLYHKRMAELASKHDVRLEFVSFPDRPFPLSILDAPHILREAIELGAQVIVIDSIVTAFLAPLFATRRLALPTIAMLHQPAGGINQNPLRTAVQRPLDRHCYGYVSRVLVASDLLSQQIQGDGVEAGRITVIRPGRDVTTQVMARQVDLRQGRHTACLCVANWIKTKGIYELLEALAHLPGEKVTLHLVGRMNIEPGYTTRIQKRIAENDLAGRVVVHGLIPPDAVASLYTAADFFVLPSFKESYGTVYGEAMSFGLPVVGWRSGNLPHLVTDEQEGLLVPPGDIDGLAVALRRLSDDEEFRRGLGAAAARRALTWPTWEDSATLFFDAIHDAAHQYNS